MMAQLFKYCYIFIIFNHWTSEKKGRKLKVVTLSHTNTFQVAPFPRSLSDKFEILS